VQEGISQGIKREQIMKSKIWISVYLGNRIRGYPPTYY
jgi:hypothetical protein